ncbi:MAG: phosphoheptose isomerase [Planctomycetota bacterium]|nr:MAG: phosphoheptose isomerase [Planctomycetota bacterium]
MNRYLQIDNYFSLVTQALDKIDRHSISAFVDMVLRTSGSKANVYVFGNGGSGATASHICGDFAKGVSYGSDRKLKAICLNDNTPVLTALANDVSYDDIFVEQIKNLLKPDDLVVGISGSGNSINVVKALEYANSIGAATVAFCGFCGGKIKQIASLAVHAEINNMEIVEDLHMIIAHCVKNIIITEFKAGTPHHHAERQLSLASINKNAAAQK